MKSALKNQPLSICIDASALDSYSSGIIPASACPHNRLDHCVLLYGYDSNAWLLKNSWGKSWGEKGFFRFQLGKDTCGVRQEVMTVNVK